MVAALALCRAHAAARVLPSGATVPQNLLRIEIEFEPALHSPLDMRQVELLGADGEPIEAALLDVPLLSRDGRRATILMNPGRIKTGVRPNAALGLALREGERVTLRINDPQLHAPLTKAWRVVAADRERLVPAAWKFNVPAAGSRAMLDVALPSAVGVSAKELIAVADSRGERIAGTAELSRGETHWIFVPARPWRTGGYQLRVHPNLEDVAGNQPCAAFEANELHATDCSRDSAVAFHIAATQRRGP